MTWSAARRVSHATVVPATVALVVGACTLALIVQRHDDLGRRHLEQRADVVDAAIDSIERDADRAAASVAGALTGTSEPAQLRAILTALVDESALTSTLAIVDDAGTIVAANQDSSLVTRAVVEARLSGLSPTRAELILSDAHDDRDRLLFAASSPRETATVLVELSLERSTFQDLPFGTAFTVTVIDPRIGGVVAHTDAAVGQRALRRSVSLGGQPALLTVSGDGAASGRRAWAAALLAAMCAAVATTTLRSAIRWRAERQRSALHERVLDGVFAHQQRIEADLRTSETQLRAMLESNPDTVALLDPIERRCELLNRRELLGYSAANLDQCDFVFTITNEESVLRDWWSSLSIARGDAGNWVEFWATSTDGDRRRMQLRAAPIGSGALGVRRRCLGVFTDITAQHQQREREMAMRDELERVRHLESLGRLAGGIAHDFRNVLAAVDLNTELLGARVPPDARCHLDIIQRASGRAAEMVHQLLSFAKRELGEPVAVDVSQAVLAIEPLLRSSVSSAISIDLQLDDEPCVTRAGPGHLDRVILNLVCNSRDAMPHGGMIRISTTRGPCAIPPGAPERDWVLLIVADNGTGIPGDVLEKVLDPFFTTKGPAGSGLGLASVHGLVTALGGHIAIASTPDHGTTVTIALPAEGALVPRAVSADTTTTRNRAIRRVVLVDDDDDVREPTARLLRERGLEVIEASNAYDGLAALAHDPPDVLLTDIVMPGGMNGLDLAELARREFPGVAVVVMSAHADSVIADRTPTPHRLLCKPISGPDLLDALEHAFRRAHDAA
jgi:PAS domain S-box-containing protein